MQWLNFQARQSQTNPQHPSGSLWAIATTCLGFTIWLSSAAILPSAIATPVPDNSLGTRIRNVDINGNPVTLIRGGQRRGSNQFHSFREFNIDAGERVYFDPQNNIETIIGRVRNAGGDPSQILGTLGVLDDSNADLFLLDPNGIIFGPDARLDLRGSFVATSADAIAFGNRGEFSALNGREPASTLRIDPSALLFNQLNPGAITSEAIARNVDNDTLIESGLSVNPGRSLLLIGGDVTLDDSYIGASEGRIEIGGLSEPGRIELEPDETGNLLRLTFPEETARTEITLQNRSAVDVTGNTGGDIALNGNNITISGSSLCAGIGLAPACGADRELNDAFGSLDSEAGNIVVTATQDIVLNQGGLIVNNIGNTGTGNQQNIFEATQNIAQVDDPLDVLFGSILIGAETISVSERSQVSTSTFGQGSAGLIFFSANDISLIGTAPVDGIESQLSSFVGTPGQGDAGGILLVTNTFSMTNFAGMNSSSFGQGRAGAISISADNPITDALLDGSITIADGSVIFGNVERGATRSRGGFIQLNTGTLSLQNGGQLQTLVRGTDGTVSGGQGDAGRISILATESVNLSGGLISTEVQEGASGNGGVVFITTDRFLMQNGALIESDLQGNSDVFENTIQGTNVTVDSLDAQRRAGNILIQANTIELDNSNITSTLGSETNPDASGSAGLIFMVAGDSMLLNNNSRLTSTTFAEGDAGAILLLTGRDLAVENGSLLDSVVESTATGNGGGIIIITGEDFSMNENSRITTSTFGNGLAGAVLTVSGGSSIFDNESVIDSGVGENARGNGGRIILAAEESIAFLNQSGITVRSESNSRPAGQIAASTNNGIIHLGNQSAIEAVTISGQGGDIFVNANDFLLLSDESNITTEAGVAGLRDGNGGNVVLRSSTMIYGYPSRNSNILANAFNGDGGSIFVQGTPRLENIAERSNDFITSNDINASSEFGDDGIVSVNEFRFRLLQPTEQPGVIVDASRLIGRECPRPGSGRSAEELGEFYIVGSGGIPTVPDPARPRNVNTLVTDWVTLEDEVVDPDVMPEDGLDQSEQSDVSDVDLASQDDATQFIEAQGWEFNEDGVVVLTAHAPGSQVVPDAPLFHPVSCPVED